MTGGNERWDVVVVGAGLGGLGAAVALVRAGRRVLMLEQAHQPGGYAVTFERPPYRFDASLHAYNGLAPGGGGDELLRALGISDRVDLARLDPLYLARFPDGDVVVPADPFRYEEELVRLFPSQRDGIRALFDETWAALAQMRRLSLDALAERVPPPEGFAAQYPVLARLTGRSWAQQVSSRIDDQRLLGVLTILWAYAATPPSRLDALTGLGMVGSYAFFGGWYPRGGSAAVPRALVEVLTEAGGRIEYGQRVDRIDVQDGRVRGVSTAQGLHVTCDAVVSNASGPALAHLVGRDQLPEEYLARLDALPVAASSVSVFLALDRDVMAEHRLPHEVFLLADYDQERAYAAGVRGDWDQAGLAVTDYTHHDPGCCPPGGGVVVLSATAGWDYADTWGTGGDLSARADGYALVKDRVADALVARADRAIPGLADAVRFREVATPLTNQRYTLNPAGSWAGFERRPAGTGPAPLDARTPLPNLVLAGAWTGSFGQLPSLHSGVKAARLVERALAGRE